MNIFKLSLITNIAGLTCLLTALLAGCATAPQSPAEGVAAGYGTVAAIRNTAADLLTAKVINVSEARMVQGLADQARAALDVAQAYVTAGKPTDAAGALTLASNVLAQLQTFLKNRSP